MTDTKFIEFYYNDFVVAPGAEAFATDYYTQLVMRDYLFKIYTKGINDPEIKIDNGSGIESLSKPFLSKLRTGSVFCGLTSLDQQYVYFHLVYKAALYIFSLASFVDEGNGQSVYIVSIEPMDKKAVKGFELFLEIKHKALQNSPLKNQILLIKKKEFEKDLFNSIETPEPPKVDLSDLFLHSNVKFHLERMTEEILSGAKDKKPIRYLFNGNPGTGKTQAISAIIKATHTKITTIIVEGTNYNFKDLFRFCAALAPSLLVIDDLDFVAEDRNHTSSRSQLNDLLHALDGIYSTSVYFLAATNDKGLVDLAASRPGRFDLIIDFGYLEKEEYLNLINRETNDVDLINLFDEDVLRIMENKKVTGAFIVNLIKQLTSIKKVRGIIDRETLYDLFSFSYDGFYSSNNILTKKVIGLNREY